MSAVLTLLALVAFASNSLLCRSALGGQLIDPVTFTTLRLAGGAAVLAVLARGARGAGTWGSALALFAYALAFSLAYLSLPAGTGALLLFGAVQATMIGTGLLRGERPHAGQWAGIAAALAGLVFLVRPGLAAPDPAGAVLMLGAGAAWGIYSLHGRRAGPPVSATAGNFARTVPLAVLASVAAFPSARATPAGIALALVSGGLTSGLGYVAWYRALRDLSATGAGVLQLVVPVLAAVGGVVLLGETFSSRLLVAGGLILGGVSLALHTRVPSRS